VHGKSTRLFFRGI